MCSRGADRWLKRTTMILETDLDLKGGCGGVGLDTNLSKKYQMKNGNFTLDLVP